MRLFLIMVVLAGLNWPSCFAHPGTGIVIDPEGNVFFTDLEHVWKIDTQGNVTIAVSNVHTHELLLDTSGCLNGEHVWYIEEGDKWAHYLWQLGISGEFRKTTGDIMEFPANNYLVLDMKGNSYYAVRDKEGELLMKETPEGLTDVVSRELFEDIRWIQYSPHRNSILLVDMTSIKEVCPDGEVRLIAADIAGSNTLRFKWVRDMHKIMGVWTDSDENIYTSLFGSQKVVVIDKEGEVKDLVEVEGQWSPSGGTYDPDGNLWLLEYSLKNKARVRKIGKDGQISEYYTK